MSDEEPPPRESDSDSSPWVGDVVISRRDFYTHAGWLPAELVGVVMSSSVDESKFKSAYWLIFNYKGREVERNVLASEFHETFRLKRD